APPEKSEKRGKYRTPQRPVPGQPGQEPTQDRGIEDQGKRLKIVKLQNLILRSVEHFAGADAARRLPEPLAQGQLLPALPQRLLKAQPERQACGASTLGENLPDQCSGAIHRTAESHER